MGAFQLELWINMFIDSHCHLDRLKLDPYNGDLAQAISAAHENGVDTLLCVAIDLEHIDDVLSIAERFPNVYASVGVHPGSNDCEEPTIERLLSLADRDKVIAIGETGFGIMANATFVDSDAEFNPTNFDSTFALSGVSDSANFIAFYEQDGFQARIAYNWRDEFFQRFGQNDRSTTEPTIIEEYGQWDISASYDINDTMTVFAEGINITGEEIRARGRFANQMVNVASGSARYALGIRASF